MIIKVPVEVLCEGCAGCPNLDITCDVYRSSGEVVDQHFACVRLASCDLVADAMHRSRRIREENAEKREGEQA